MVSLCAIWGLSGEHGKSLPSRALQSSRRTELKARRWSARGTLGSQEAVEAVENDRDDLKILAKGKGLWESCF